MTSTFSTTSPVVRVGIDIAKLTHQILWELPGGKRRSLRVANTKTEIDRFVGMLGALGWPCEIAFEATGDYHRPLPGSDETRREDPFATGRRGACDLVDNAWTFHLEYDALLSLVRAGRSWP